MVEGKATRFADGDKLLNVTVSYHKNFKVLSLNVKMFN